MDVLPEAVTAGAVVGRLLRDGDASTGIWRVVQGRGGLKIQRILKVTRYGHHDADTVNIMIRKLVDSANARNWSDQSLQRRLGRTLLSTALQKKL